MASENNQVPDELLLLAFGFFSPQELRIVTRVSKQWRRCADDNTLWKRFILPTVKIHSDFSYKKLYQCAPQYRVPQLRRVSGDTDSLLNNYMPLDRDKLVQFLTKHPERIDKILFHPNPDIIRLIDNIVLTHIAEMDRSKIMAIVQHLDARISIHLNRHLLMHFMNLSSEVVPYIINHPHDAVIKEINDKLIIKALEIDARSKGLVLTHTHPHIVRLRQAQVIQAKLAERPADTGCRLS